MLWKGRSSLRNRKLRSWGPVPNGLGLSFLSLIPLFQWPCGKPIQPLPKLRRKQRQLRILRCIYNKYILVFNQLFIPLITGNNPPASSGRKLSSRHSNNWWGLCFRWVSECPRRSCWVLPQSFSCTLLEVSNSCFPLTLPFVRLKTKRAMQFYLDRIW